MELTEQEKAAAKAARKRWAAEYRRQHPERIRATQERYWLRRALREQETITAADKEEAQGGNCTEN